MQTAMGAAILVLLSILVLGAATKLFVSAVREPVAAIPRFYSRRALKVARLYRILAGLGFFVFALIQMVISVVHLLSVDGLLR